MEPYLFATHAEEMTALEISTKKLMPSFFTSSRSSTKLTSFMFLVCSRELGINAICVREHVLSCRLISYSISVINWHIGNCMYVTMKSEVVVNSKTFVFLLYFILIVQCMAR